MSEPHTEQAEGGNQPSALSVQNAGPVAQHGDVTLTGALVAGRDLTVDTINVLADDGPPFGDLVDRPGHASDICPYPGLDPFDEQSAAYFHGRSADVAAILELLRRASLVSVIGSSGSGKSSLLSAGVLPALARGDVAGAAGWVVVTMRPTTQPIEQLAARIVAKMPGTTLSKVAKAIRSDPAEFTQFDASVRRACGAPVLWVVDQLEEVFHPAVDDATRAAFLAALSVAAKPTGPKVIIALRSDFYPHLDQQPELAVAVAATQHRVLPLGRQAIRDVIEKPAEQVGLRAEPALVDQILKDVGTAKSVLPLLAYALLQTWRRRRNRWLTLAEYARAGGLNGSIDRAAETVWESLNEKQRATTRRVMLRLSHLGEGSDPVRRQTRLEDLATNADDAATVRNVVDRLASARIVTVDFDEVTKTRTVDITHEAVLRSWRLLRTWLTEDRDAKRAQEDLSNGAAAWQRHGTDSGYLLQGARLAAVESARRGNRLTLNDLESRYLAQSKRLDRRQRLRSRLIMALAAILVLAVATTAVVLAQQQRIIAERTVADALQLAAQSRSVVQQHRDLGALLAVAGVHTDDNPVTRAAVMDAVAARGGPLAYLLPADVRATTVADALTPDGSAIVGTSDGAIRILSAADGHETAPSLAGHRVNITAVDSAGDLVVSGDAAGLVSVHRVGAAEPLHQPVHATSAVVAIAISQVDNQVLAATTFGSIERWQVGEQLVPLPPLPRSPDIVDLAVDDTTDQFAAINTAGAIPRWRLSSGAELPQLAKPGELGTGTTMRLDVVGDGRLITVANNRLGVWDLRADRPPTWADVPDGTAVSPAPDAEVVFVGTHSGTIAPWRLASGPLAVEPIRFGLASPVVAVAAGGTYLVGVDQQGRVVSWDLSGRRSPASTPLVESRGQVHAVARNAAGAIASAGLDGIVRVTQDQVTTEAHSFGVPINGVAWTPSGFIVVGTSDGAVLELDPATGTVRTLAARRSAVVALTSDNRGTVAAAYGDGEVLLPTRPDVVIPPAGAEATALSLSPDGNSLAIASFDGASAPLITIRSAADGFQSARTLTGHTLAVGGLAFSPDGKVLASGNDDGTVRLWSVENGTMLTELREHTDMVLAVAYTPDGRMLATGSQDGTIRLWDIDLGVQIGQPLQFRDEFVTSLAASADGDRLVAANGDTVVEWPFALQAWIDRACQMAGREITAAEWSRLAPSGVAPSPCA